MTKKEICTSKDSFAYWSGCGGVEFKKIEYGINDYVYCVSGAWGGKKGYHKLKLYYGATDCYIKLHGYRIPFRDCIRMK